MGRYPSIAASKQKTGAAKSKIYSMYAREIYQAAKNGGTEPEANSILKRLIDKAKSEQVPVDIIKRAIDKVNSGADETYDSVSYELFGPGGSTLIVDCLTDNVNRSVSNIRAVVNKCHVKMGAMGSVSYLYDTLCVVGVKGFSEDEVMELMIEHDLDFSDLEKDGEVIIVYGNPTDLYSIKNAFLEKNPKLTFELDEITKLPHDRITLEGEDLETFQRLITLLDDVEDVNHIYHNVEL